MKHIVVTGSSGTIGTELCIRLLDKGYKMTGIDRVRNRWSEQVQERTTIVDLRNANLADHIPDSVDVIVHLAANARVHELVEAPGQAVENYVSTFEVLNYAREVDADIIFGSSREVYGNQQQTIFQEDDVPLERVPSPYTASKIGEESMIRAFSNCYGISSTILRFSNVYGRYDVSNRVVPLFISRANRDLPLTVFGSEKILDFTYLSDCIDGILATIKRSNKAQGETFNIASGNATTLVELAQTVVNILDSQSSISIESTRTGEVTQFVANINKARQLLNYDPSVDLHSGIERTIDWYDDKNLYNEILEYNE